MRLSRLLSIYLSKRGASLNGPLTLTGGICPHGRAVAFVLVLVGFIIVVGKASQHGVRPGRRVTA
jgi:hypothetical protein